MDPLNVICGDTLSELRKLPDGSVHCCVTSPPYWGLRDYGVEGQLGLESTPQEYVAKIVEVFREVRRVLREDGTSWVNLGDSYYNYRTGYNGALNKQSFHKGTNGKPVDREMGLARRCLKQDGLKEKDLVGIPWSVAFALRDDGWYLRSDIIWSKPNPMPESVTDRPTKAHEYIFLFSKSESYHYDAGAIKEAGSQNPVTVARNTRSDKGFAGASGLYGTSFGQSGNGGYERKESISRNKRSVWTVPTVPFKGAHFATFPPKLIEPCILAGCPVGGTVLDPFAGSGTTGQVALDNGRFAILIELNPAYITLIHERCATPLR